MTVNTLSSLRFVKIKKEFTFIQTLFGPFSGYSRNPVNSSAFERGYSMLRGRLNSCRPRSTLRSSNQIHLERDGITRNSSMGKALQEYLDIRFNKRKQEGDEGGSHKSLQRSALYNASLPLFPREPSFTRCLRGRDIYLHASATKARNENMCWMQEASLACLFSEHIAPSNRLRFADIKIFRYCELVYDVPEVTHFFQITNIRSKIKDHDD